MSKHDPGKNNLTSFPVLISAAVLALAIASGVINYRQNHLANLESTLRDTREKLVLATKELSDTKLRAVIDYVYGERNRVLRREQEQKSAAMDFDSEKKELLRQLADANDRIKELELLAEKLSSDLDQKGDALEALEKKQETSMPSEPKASEPEPTGTEPSKPSVSKPDASESEIVKASTTDVSKSETVEMEAARSEASKVETAKAEMNQDATLLPLAGSADIDVYQSGMDMATRKQVDEAMRNIGLKPKYPVHSGTTKPIISSTIFFYDESYESVASILARELNASIKQPIPIRKGSSPYNKNKIIVHLIGK